MPARASPQPNGFTLIELSIVLVIIGLVMGGIVVGRELIRAAQVRATITQLEQFRTAVNTFRTKYQCLPGDCANASAFGMDVNTNGDGNGFIGCEEVGNATIYCASAGPPLATNRYMAEYVNFWYHLSAVDLIAPKFAAYDSSQTAASSQGAGKVTPAAKISLVYAPNTASAGWAIRGRALFSDDVYGMQYLHWREHHFSLAERGIINAVEYTGGLGPYHVIDVMNMDQKLDDGLPLAGNVRAWSINAANINLYSPSMIVEYFANAGPASSNFCVNDSTPPQYNLLKNVTAVGWCGLVIKAGF